MSHSKQAYDYTVTKLFELQVLNTPNLVALRNNNVEYSYNLLNEKANQLAFYLKKKSVTAGDPIAILLEPGADFIICVLAIIKAGAIYVSMDAFAPKNRIKDILDDAKPKLVISNELYRELLNETESEICLIKQIHLETISYPKENEDQSITPSSPIYMMYTSGSTGRPKGVIIPHQAVVNVMVVENSLNIRQKNKVAQFSNIAFDGSTFEIWSALLNGAALYIIPNIVKNNHSALKETLDTNQIQYMFLPTSYLHQLIKSAPETLNSVSTVLFGGEQVNPVLIQKFLEYRKKANLFIELINGYGPTETTAYVCYQRMNSNEKYKKSHLSSIGKFITNTKGYILDHNMNSVSEGELFVSGANLAIGYHNCDIQNNEKFIKNPFCNTEPYTKLYKTGDKVRLLPSGNLLCLGRYDDQVKIGGFRIHLNEIETDIIKHPDISMASVTVEIGGGAHKILTAYVVVTSKEKIIHADDIRNFLKNTLPHYMLPAKYVRVEELPLTLIGKVDKTQLGTLSHIDLSFHVDTSASSFIEEKIKQIWQNLLNRTAIDTHKNLFDLGANSLLITESCVKINEALQSELQISNILEYPTIHKLSRYLEGDIAIPAAKRAQKEQHSDIAIVGMACRFPKATNLEEYWENLCNGINCLDTFSEEQLKTSLNDTSYYDSSYVPTRGVLSGIDEFDANFFGFNPTDISITDPQQRLLLECAWEALEHAAIAPNKLDTKIISVFAGMTDSSYLHENLLKNHWFCSEYDVLHQRIACSTSMLSTQISYRLNFKGRSINVNTACSTGLITVDQACQDLILGHSDVALAGAASIVVPQQSGYLFQQGSILSADGHCRPFADTANGTVFSNGVGVVVMKRLKDAIADHDTIYAVIKGRGVNNDGADKLGFTAPSTSGQMTCIRDALDQAKINADAVGLVEAHGTATALGDIIEINALTSVYREQTDKKQYCALGSVKANIGHTDVAAGIAGLIKTALSLYHKKIPPLLHFEKPNPNLLLENSPFLVNTTLIDWVSKSNKRYAGISSFGVGGTNAHIILGNHVKREISALDETKEELILLSAKNEAALKEQIFNLTTYLSKPENHSINLANVAYSLQSGREDFSWRVFGIGKTSTDIINDIKLKKPAFIGEDTHHSIVFMFPGQGMQYCEMAMELFDAIPAFAAYIEKGISLAKPYLDCDLLTIIRDPNQDELLQNTKYSQPALFIIEYALAKLLIDYGIYPEALIGHSLGEYVAACLSGVFSFEDGIALICERGLLMSNTDKGEMLAIECSEEEFLQYQLIIKVELALHNAPFHCVASGDSFSIKCLEEHLIDINKSYIKLPINHAFHSQLMESIEKPFKDLVSTITLCSPTIPIISNVTGDWLSAEDATNINYWYSHLRHTVRLCDGFKTLSNDKHLFFIEVGPGRSLSTFLKNLIINTEHLPHFITHTMPSRNKKIGDMHQLLVSIGELWQQGLPIQWEAIYKNQNRNKLSLPTYPFQKQRYWVEPDNIKTATHTGKLYRQVWSRQKLAIDYNFVTSETIHHHSWIVFKDSKGLGDRVISLLKQYNVQPIIIEFRATYNEINSSHFLIDPSQKDHYTRLLQKTAPNLINPIVLHLCSLNMKDTSDIDKKFLDHGLDLGFYSLLYLTQTYIEILGKTATLKALILTTGTQQILGSEVMVPINACVNSMCNVINQEHPALSFQSIDIDINEPIEYFERSLPSLMKIIISPSEHKEFAIALRNSSLWNMAHAQISHNPKINRFKDEGIYLITGGLGGISLTICSAIITKVRQPKFILISRSPAIPEHDWNTIMQEPTHPLFKKILSLKNLIESGATIYWHQADINHYPSIASVIKFYQQKLGQISGVIHAAGIAGGGLIQLKSKDMARNVLMPKILGTYNLAKALKTISPDFVVLMSSIASLIGEQGQVDYSAANACLDTFAATNLFSCSYVVSINWNTWREVGMSIETAEHKDITFLNRGNDISPQQGKALFLQIMENNYTNVAVSNYDLDQHEDVLLQHKHRSNPSVTKTSREILNIQHDYLPPTNPTEKIFTELWQESLGIDCIGIHDDFFGLGGHSLKALQLIDKMNKVFESSLSIQHLYKNPTIHEISKLINKKDTEQTDIVVLLKDGKKNTPYIFLCHPASGMIYCFNSLASQWNTPLSIFGLQDPSVSAGKLLYNSIRSIATEYLKAIKKIQPEGPYNLLGYSFGGSVVYEIANLLQQDNEKINLLALIEGWCTFSKKQFDEHYFKNNFQAAHQHLSNDLTSLAWDRMKLLLNHKPSPMNHDMILFKATELLDEYQSIDHPVNGWSDYNLGNISCQLIQANHETILNPENSLLILEIIQKMGIFNETPKN